MSIKGFFKQFPLTRGMYAKLKQQKEARREADKFDYHGKFIDRSKGKDRLCIVLAGYKDYLYEPVFSRIQKFAPDDMDFCVVTSGKFDPEIDLICKNNDWSYLSTEENNVSLVQNVAIKLHPNANYIFKLDEDIFITEGYFANLMRAYQHSKDGKFFPGVMAPLIPINGYCHVRILEKLGVTNEYEKRYGEVKYAAGPKRPVENSSDVAKFFWGNEGVIPDIDTMNKMFFDEPIEERAVPIRFSIGAILFERSLWEDMGYFEVDRSTVSLGRDESQMCSYCCVHSRPIMVSENVLVGHFSFGPQNSEMKDYYFQNRDKFDT